jgi:DNA ligase-1
MTIKPMRAANWEPKKIKPGKEYWVEPKIDGVRGYNPNGVLFSRNLKPHANRFTTIFFSKPEYEGYDGELAAQDERHPSLCRLTTSALNTQNGSPFMLWHIFDYVTADTISLPYRDRYRIMQARLKEQQSRGLCGQLRVVPYVVCHSLDEIEAAHNHNMELGYEGSCIYDPNQKHKEGKSSPTHGGVVRIKDFIDFEAEILSYSEAQENLNEQTRNELGNLVRSSHKENKIGLGMVGNINARAIDDVFDLYDTSKLLIAKGQEFTSGPGEMSHEDRVKFFLHPELFVGEVGTFKFFPKGQKDKPRFPIFKTLRDKDKK